MVKKENDYAKYAKPILMLVALALGFTLDDILVIGQLADPLEFMAMAGVGKLMLTLK